MDAGKRFCEKQLFGVGHRLHTDDLEPRDLPARTDHLHDDPHHGSHLASVVGRESELALGGDFQSDLGLIRNKFWDDTPDSLIAGKFVGQGLRVVELEDFGMQFLAVLVEGFHLYENRPAKASGQLFTIQANPTAGLEVWFIVLGDHNFNHVPDRMKNGVLVKNRRVHGDSWEVQVGVQFGPRNPEPVIYDELSVAFLFLSVECRLLDAPALNPQGGEQPLLRCLRIQGYVDRGNMIFRTESRILGTLGLLGIVIIGNFGQVFFLLGITDEKCH